MRAHEGIIDANFAREKAGIEITLTSFTQNSERYVVSRYYGEPAKVLDEQGKVLQLTPKDVLPRAEVYGQNELLAIVQDCEAKAKPLGRFLPLAPLAFAGGAFSKAGNSQSARQIRDADGRDEARPSRMLQVDLNESRVSRARRGRPAASSGSGSR